jgi:hypothetical protein
MIIHTNRVKRPAQVAPQQPKVESVVQEQPKPERRHKKKERVAVEQQPIQVVETIEATPEEKAKKIFEEIEQEVSNEE